MRFFERSRPVLTEPCGLGYAQLLRLADEDLMQHLALRHDDALAVLYDRYHRLVRAVALKVLRDESEADDVTQEVFLKLYRTVAQFDAARGMTRMWILRLAYQVSFNRRRYLKVRSFEAPEPEAGLIEPAAGGRESAMWPPESARLVRQVLGLLDERQRRTIEWACFDGLTMSEIAEATGESVGNVRHHYYRGMAKLRGLLADRAVLASDDGDVRDASARQLA